MKCTACGADVKGEKVCGACGTKVTDAMDKLEVEYKDFKISEFLEIRSKSHELQETTEPASDDPREKDVLSGVTVKKKPLRLIMSIILILAFLAGVIYLLHYFSIW